MVWGYLTIEKRHRIRWVIKQTRIFPRPVYIKRCKLYKRYERRTDPDHWEIMTEMDSYVKLSNL